MLATPASLAAAARKYTVESSASLDPFEEPHVDADDAAAIQQWLRHVEQTMAAHRSPFVAAEIILQEMHLFAQGRLRRPERLYMATALPVLNHCLPSLTAEYRDVVAAAVHELIPAMVFTKAQCLVGPHGSPAGEPARRVSYAECFWRVYALYAKHKRTIEVHARRAEVETAVMDRVVLSLDRLWVKMCFLSWKIHCRQIREKKLLFKKLAHRGMAGHIVPQYIRAWRQYAHSTMLATKVARSSEVARELEALYPEEQRAKSLHERANEEVREKVRVLNEETTRAEQTRAKLDTLRALHDETERSLSAHWRTWRACMSAMFGDTHPINKALEEDFTNSVTYSQNITDTAELYSRRARTRTGKVGLRQIQACLRSQGYLSGASDEDPQNEEKERDDVRSRERAGDDGADSVVSAGFPRANGRLSARPLSGFSTPGPSHTTRAATTAGTAGGGSGRKTRYAKGPPASDSVDATIDAFRRACSPVVAPLRLIDLLRGNQVNINVALSFLSYMYSGGHCSLFWPPSLQKAVVPTASSPESTTRTDSATPGTPCAKHGEGQQRSGVTSEEEKAAALPPPPQSIGARMLRDVDLGMDNVPVTSEGNDRYLLSIRRCMESNAVDAVQDFLGNVFARASTMGLPLARERVEQALETLVRRVDGPVIRALYPAQGIHTFTEFSEYLAKVAEFSSVPLISIGERLENGYAFSPREEMLYALNTSEDVRFVLRESHEYVARLLEWAKDEQHPDQLSREKCFELLTAKLGLSEDAANEVWQGAGAENDVVTKDELEVLLYLAAAFMDPSPFTAPADKLAVVMDRCVPFLLGL